MYPIEKYLKTLKGNVQNPKASMVKGYAIDEAFGFYMEYMQTYIITNCKVRDAKEIAQ